MTDGETNKRDRGILSPADREYLHGRKEDLTEQSKRDTRYRIRKRVENGIYDMALLAKNLDPDDRKQIFKKIFDNEDQPGAYTLAVGFLVGGLFDISEPPDHAAEHLEDDLKAALHETLLEMDDEYMIDVEVNVDIDREKPDIEELMKKYDQGEESYREFQYLLRREKIDFGLETALRSLEHMHEDGIITAGDEIRIMGDEEEVPVDFDEETDFGNFQERFKQAWQNAFEGDEGEEI